jgi:hypothetical protein
LRHYQLRPPRAKWLFYSSKCCCGRVFRRWRLQDLEADIRIHEYERRTVMTSFTSFVDVTGSNSHNVPDVPELGLIALYATGSDGIEATAAEIARFKNVGVGVILIDQTPSLSVWSAGLADVADIEALAGTYGAAADGALNRGRHGWVSTCYVSQSNLGALVSVLQDNKVDLSRVVFGIANYDDSIVTAEDALNANESWVYVQYGDPESNPRTLVPGTKVTLEQAQCDIDIAKSSWASQFDPKKPAPAPTGPFRQLTDGKQSMAEIARIRGADPINLMKLSQKSYTVADLTILADAVLPAGIPYYTNNP